MRDARSGRCARVAVKVYFLTSPCGASVGPAQMPFRSAACRAVSLCHEPLISPMAADCRVMGRSVARKARCRPRYAQTAGPQSEYSSETRSS